MESCSDSDSNDDGIEIGRHGYGDEDIVINTEHASKEVDKRNRYEKQFWLFVKIQIQPFSSKWLWSK